MYRKETSLTCWINLAVERVVVSFARADWLIVARYSDLGDTLLTGSFPGCLGLDFMHTKYQLPNDYFSQYTSIDGRVCLFVLLLWLLQAYPVKH